MLPMGKGRPQPDVPVPTNVPAYTKFQELSNIEFLQSTRRYREISQQIKVLEAEKETLSSFLQAMFTVADLPAGSAVLVDNIILQFVASKSASQLNAQKLIECGVDADLIAACTDEGKAYTYVQTKVAKG